MRAAGIWNVANFLARGFCGYGGIPLHGRPGPFIISHLQPQVKPLTSGEFDIACYSPAWPVQQMFKLYECACLDLSDVARLLFITKLMEG